MSTAKPGEVLSAGAALRADAPVTHIVPYPYSSNIELLEGAPSPMLSVMSRMSVDAAVSLRLAHPEAKIVLVGEDCYGDGHPTTSDLMVARGRQLGLSEGDFETIPRLRDGRPLNNTYLQTRGLAEYAEDRDLDSDTLLVSGLDYHLPRIAGVVRAYKNLRGANFTTAEGVLHGTGNHTYDRYLPFIDGLAKSENVLKLINKAFPKGSPLNLFMKLQGARVVDVVEDGEGGLTLENTLAAKKLAELQAQAAAGHTGLAKS